MTTPTPRPASTWRVFDAFASLAALAGAFGFVLLAKTGETEPAKVLDPAFTLRALPFGFESRFAAELPFGQKLVRFAPPGVELGVPEAGRATPLPTTASVPGEPGEPGTEPKIAWKKLAIAPTGAPPREAMLVFLADATRAALRPYFEDPTWRSLGDLDDTGGWVAIDEGTLTWASFEPRYVILRHFAAPGVYSDHARVDLSAEGRGCVLCIDWARGATASKDALVELAQAFEPKPKSAP